LKAKRSRLSIIIDVLSYLSEEGGEAPATRIAQATGLAYDRLVKLLEELNEKGVVAVEAGERLGGLGLQGRVWCCSRGLEI